MYVYFFFKTNIYVSVNGNINHKGNAMHSLYNSTANIRYIKL